MLHARKLKINRTQDRIGDSDTKLFLAQGLAMQQTELTAVMLYVGTVWGDQSPAKVMETARENTHVQP